MRALIVVAACLGFAAPALAQSGSTPAPAPAAGSGDGGGVGPSQMTPRAPTGRTPPGTPHDRTVAGQRARNATGQRVIGHTTTPPSAVPGNTGGQGTGTR